MSNWGICSISYGIGFDLGLSGLDGSAFAFGGCALEADRFGVDDFFEFGVEGCLVEDLGVEDLEEPDPVRPAGPVASPP